MSNYFHLLYSSWWTEAATWARIRCTQPWRICRSLWLASRGERTARRTPGTRLQDSPLSADRMHSHRPWKPVASGDHRLRSSVGPRPWPGRTCRSTGTTARRIRTTVRQLCRPRRIRRLRAPDERQIVTRTAPRLAGTSPYGQLVAPGLWLDYAVPRWWRGTVWPSDPRTCGIQNVNWVEIRFFFFFPLWNIDRKENPDWCTYGNLL